MFTQPIDENDPNYYEKETARLAQEQALVATNLMDAFIQEFPKILNHMQKEFIMRTWKALLGEKYTDEIERVLEL